MEIDALAAAFFARFKGLDRASGFYGRPPVGQPGEKVKAAAAARGAPSVDAWAKHLRGEEGLGIVPICEGNICYFGANDIDDYNLDLPKFAADLAETNLPLIPCRTKSGGVHLYLFLSEPAPAELVVAKLSEWSIALGFSGSEIFPKQTMLTKSSMGNWINMPYFNVAETNRYAMDATGAALSAEQFLERAEKFSLTASQLAAITIDQGDTLADGPPCLQTLAARKDGFPAGSRNNALFNLAVYARKRYPDDWGKHVENFNKFFMRPSKDAREVADIIKSCGKKTYAYKCGDQPIVAHCNRTVCLTRRFGVGGGMDDPGVVFGDLIKLETDPPIWLWSVNGRDVELSTEQLLNPRLAQSRIAECINLLPRLIKKTAWDKMIAEKLEDVEIYQVPADANPEGQWEVHLNEFCTGRMAAKAFDEILLGRAYTEPKDGRTYFKSTAFLEFLKKKHITVEPRKLYNWFRKLDGKHSPTSIKGKFVSVWSVPRFSEQTEEHHVPRGEQI